jgi:hypothetical protein
VEKNLLTPHIQNFDSNNNTPGKDFFQQPKIIPYPGTKQARISRILRVEMEVAEVKCVFVEDTVKFDAMSRSLMGFPYSCCWANIFPSTLSKTIHLRSILARF